MPEVVKCIRSYDFNLIKREDSEPGTLEGYAVVFNQRTAIGDWFYEEIAPNALDDSDLSDVMLLVNHDDRRIPLARHRRGKRSTMDLVVDKTGLGIKASLDINDNTDARNLNSAVKRGDVSEMSFAFWIAGEEWRDLDKEMPTRIITKIERISEVSAVNNAAYPQTSISARAASLDNEKRALENARAAMLDNRKVAEAAQAALKLEKEKLKLKFGGNI